jgi:hypothetical protein
LEFLVTVDIVLAASCGKHKCRWRLSFDSFSETFHQKVYWHKVIVAEDVHSGFDQMDDFSSDLPATN